MRTFRLAGMASLAIMMCVNFAACSSDDDEIIKNDDGVITNQKRLVEIKDAYGDGSEAGTSVMTFSYDSKNRLISVVEKGSDSHDNITNSSFASSICKF